MIAPAFFAHYSLIGGPFRALPGGVGRRAAAGRALVLGRPSGNIGRAQGRCFIFTQRWVWFAAGIYRYLPHAPRRREVAVLVRLRLGPRKGICL